MDVTTKSCGQRHAGSCTADRRLYTRAEAIHVLYRRGFTFNEERADWERGALRGRLAWIPDYCHPERADVGTRWFLVQPYGMGEVPVLGSAS